MNKWLLRLIGLFILMVVVWFFKGWFFPEIPAVLQEQIALSDTQQPQVTSPQPPKTAAQQPILKLTSLEERKPSEETTPKLSQPVQPTESKITAQESVQTPVTRTEQPPQRGGSWVQAGAFSSIDNANNFADRLRKKSWPVEIEKAVIDGKVLHRVFVGPLAASDVEPYIEILGKMGFNARQVSR